MKTLTALAGSWTGTAKLWWEVDSVPLDSPATATIRAIADGHGLLVETTTAVEDAPAMGALLIAFDPEKNRHTVSWIDSFHAGAGMVSIGPVPEAGLLAVTGSYPSGDDTPDWGWNTLFTQPSRNELVITMENVPPGGKAYRAVELRLKRG